MLDGYGHEYLHHKGRVVSNGLNEGAVRALTETAARRNVVGDSKVNDQIGGDRTEAAVQLGDSVNVTNMLQIAHNQHQELIREFEE